MKHRRSDGLPPVAPTWRDVAIKYRDDPRASEHLTRTVLSGSDPNARHWAGKIGVVTMPPNAAAISEADARALVNWILVLVPSLRSGILTGLAAADGRATRSLQGRTL